MAVLIALYGHSASPDYIGGLKLFILMCFQQLLCRFLTGSCDNAADQLILIKAFTKLVKQLQETQHARLGVTLIENKHVIFFSLHYL
jgi:hypothetical protein